MTDSDRQIQAEIVEIRQEMDADRARSQQAHLRRIAELNKPTLVGVIYLVGGERKEFTDYIRFFAARAFYSLRGRVKLAVHSVWAPCEGVIPIPAAVQQREAA